MEYPYEPKFTNTTSNAVIPERWWWPILFGLLATPVAFVLAVLSHGIGHGVQALACSAHVPSNLKVEHQRARSSGNVGVQALACSVHAPNNLKVEHQRARSSGNAGVPALAGKP
jgi:hypothetical protein